MSTEEETILQLCLVGNVDKVEEQLKNANSAKIFVLYLQELDNININKYGAKEHLAVVKFLMGGIKWDPSNIQEWAEYARERQGLCADSTYEPDEGCLSFSVPNIETEPMKFWRWLHGTLQLWDLL